MTGTELIQRIKELGEEREIEISASGECEGCGVDVCGEIDSIWIYEEKILLEISRDESGNRTNY